jgi:tetratricopeptide (TPR) repeat protein
LTELKLARAKWSVPDGRILPVMVEPTPMSDVPAYLKAVTILEPKGSVSAETAAAVDDMVRALSRKNHRWKIAAGLGVTALLAIGIAAFVLVPGRLAPPGTPEVPKSDAIVSACFGPDLFSAIESGALTYSEARELGQLCADRLILESSDDSPSGNQRAAFAERFAAAATSSDADERRAAAIVTKGDVEDSVRAFLALARSNSDPVAKASDLRSAAALAFQSHPELAAEALEQLTAIEPDDLVSWSALARVNATLGRTENAEEAASEFSKRAGASGGDWAAAAALQEAQRLAPLNRLDEARSKVAEAKSLFQQSGNQWGIAMCIALDAEMSLTTGDFQRAEQLASDALTIGKNYKFKDIVANALTLLGRVNMMKLDYSTAEAQFIEAETILDEIGNTLAKTFVTTQRGFIAMNEQKLPEAKRLFESVRAEQVELGHKEGVAWSDINLANIAQFSGDPEGARKRLRGARSVFAEIGSANGEAQAIFAEAGIDTMLGRSENALELLTSARAIGEANGLRLVIEQSLISSAYVYRTTGRIDLARADYAEALDYYTADGNDPGALWTREQLGQLAIGQNDVAEAKAQWQEALRLSRKLGMTDTTNRLEHELAKLD